MSSIQPDFPSHIPQTKPRAAVVVFTQSPHADALRWGWGEHGIHARAALTRHTLAKLTPLSHPSVSHPSVSHTSVSQPGAPNADSASATDIIVFHRGEVERVAGVRCYAQQNGASFQARLTDAVRRTFAMGYDRVIVVGTDVPSLQARHVRHALDLLNHNRLVLGPDTTGGCYLIALNSGSEHLLNAVTWERNTDLRQLRHLAGTDSALLPAILPDADAPETLRACLGASLRGSLRRSIGTSPAAAHLPAALRASLERVLLPTSTDTARALPISPQSDPPAASQLGTETRTSRGPPALAAPAPVMPAHRAA